MEKMDPVVFVDQWSKAISIDVPDKRDKPSATKALGFHALLLYDSPANTLNVRDRNRRIRQQLAVYRDLLDTFGFIETTVRLKKIAQTFLRSFHVLDGKLTYELNEDISCTPMYWCAKTLCNREINVGGNDDFQLIQYILSWLLYLSKAPFNRPDLEDSAKNAWIERQVNPLPILASRCVLDDLRRLVSWLLSVDSFTKVGNHGPGTTLGGWKTVPEKNQDYFPTVQSSQLTNIHVDDIPYSLSKTRDNELLLVEKDVSSLRPITREPVETQYGQQALKFDLYEITDGDFGLPIGRFVRYRDQLPSQRAAVRGSRIDLSGPKPSTIDLSSASDNLSVDLVAELFSGELLHLLMAGRTWNCSVDEQTIELSMYGGMGSALTFPVQTTIFTACAVYATLLELSYREIGVWDPEYLSDYLDGSGFVARYRQYGSCIRIYGDDICLPDFAAERLVKLLESLGLKVNVDKSFIGDSPVRESCGIYALAGRDITPARYRLPTLVGKMDYALYESIRLHANVMFQLGWRHMNRGLIRYAVISDKLISSKCVKRKTQRGKAYPAQAQGKPCLLFEEDHGEGDYVGFISMRPSIPSISLELHERVLGYTTYYVETKTTRDDTSEYYHLNLAYRQMFTLNEASTEAHGSIPRDIRLSKRNAIPIKPNGYAGWTWGWAPM